MNRNSSHQVHKARFGKIEIMIAGDYNLAGVNLGGMKDTMALEEVFFNNNAFGVKRRNNQMFRTMGCDYCFWTIHFRNR